MVKTQNHEVIPSAKRLIKSLRDIGYDFPTAVADLIDNSIEAGATKVTIDVEFDGDNSWVRVSDNGIGMELQELQEAMRYGSEREYDGEADLGKFGLGLKTASLSQCKRMIVASRGDLNHKEVNAYSWDLDHVDATNKWEIIKVSKDELKFILAHHLDDATGTVVIWQKLDRIMGYKHPYGEMAKKRLLEMCRSLELHLAMVFHRFLAGEVPGKKLQIILNGNKVDPWDPFARVEANTQCLDTISLSLEYEGKSGMVILEPFVLPHQDLFSSRDDFNRASGPKKWNRQQGFYIYRANRLIQSGSWSGLRTIDEHTKLARVSLSFSPHLDDAFKINVAKMKVQLPAQLRDKIEAAINPVVKLARHAYDNSNKKNTGTISARGGSFIPPEPNSIERNTEISKSHLSEKRPLSLPPNTGVPHITQMNNLWTLDELQYRLEILAKPDEKPVLMRVLERLRKSINS